jgi:hypothetical protein
VRAYREEHEAADTGLAVWGDKLRFYTPAIIEHFFHIGGCLVNHELWNRSRYTLDHRELLEVTMLHEKSSHIKV